MPAATMTASFVIKSRSQRLPMTATACQNTDAALAHQQHMAASSHEGSSCRSRRCHQLERKQEAQATWLDSRVSPGQQCQRPEEVENKTNAPEKGSGQKKTERQATNSTITNGLAQAPRSCDGLAQSNQQQAARRQQAAAISGTVQAVAAGRRLQQDATQQ